MFQEDSKESFIQDYIRSRIVAKTSLYSLFKKTEIFEKELNKDCSEFTKEEILHMYERFNAKSVSVLLNYNTILKAYCAWIKYYKNNELQSFYDGVSAPELKPFVINTNRLLTREDITEIEDQLFNWTDKAIIECLWEGISGKNMCDLVAINKSILNDSTKEIYFSDGRVFKLTDRLYELLLKAFEEDEYICYGETLRVKKLIGYGTLYKERDNARDTDTEDKYFRWVYRKIQNVRSYLDINGLTMKNIQASGMYYYLKKGMEDTKLDLRHFLLSEPGSKLSKQYGFYSNFRVDNIIYKFKDFFVNS